MNLNIVLELHNVKAGFQGTIPGMLGAHGTQIANVKKHLGPMTAKDGTVTLTYMDGLETRRQTLLNYSSNPVFVADHASKRKILVDEMLADKDHVKDVFYFIEKGFEEDQWHDQKVLAGYTFWLEADTDYEKAGEMMNAVVNYWARPGISALLIAQGANAATGTTLSDGKTHLQEKGDIFKASLTVEHEAANQDMKAYNLFHKDCMVVDKLSKIVFKADKEIRDGQTYTVIYQSAHPEHQVVQHVVVRRASRKEIKNAVQYEMVKCLSVTPADLYDGTKPIIPQNKLATLQKDQEIENIWGSDLVFINSLTTGEALIETTRMVHAK